MYLENGSLTFASYKVATIEEAMDPNATHEVIKDIYAIMGIILLILFLSGGLYLALALTASITLAARLKHNYLAAILKQDCTWFDQNNYTELAARISHECSLIQKATGEKFAMVIFSFGMCIVSFAIGFSSAWTLTLALLAMGPFMVIGLGLFLASLTSGMANVVRSYGQSAGYAEQALSSIRVVISYGMEMAEIENYSTYLV